MTRTCHVHDVVGMGLLVVCFDIHDDGCSYALIYAACVYCYFDLGLKASALVYARSCSTHATRLMESGGELPLTPQAVITWCGRIVQDVLVFVMGLLSCAFSLVRLGDGGTQSSRPLHAQPGTACACSALPTAFVSSPTPRLTRL